MMVELALAIAVVFVAYVLCYFTPSTKVSKPEANVTSPAASEPDKHAKNEHDFKCLSIHHGTLTHCLQPNYDLKQINAIYPVKNESHIIYLQNVLSTAECESLITETNELSYLNLEGFDGKVRDNKRRRTYDELMSVHMFNRIAPFVPKVVDIDGCKWQISRILDYWRYCKYAPTQHFSPHYDGSKVLESYEMSVFTINIYLNDCFKGGATRFYMQCKQDAKENDLEEAGPVTDEVQPVQGDALVFNHCDKGYLHDGERLGNNLKYIMRADLLYRCVEVDKLRKLENSGKCKFWSSHNAKNEVVKNYIGRTWKCACISKHVTVTLH